MLPAPQSRSNQRRAGACPHPPWQLALHLPRHLHHALRGLPYYHIGTGSGSGSDSDDDGDGDAQEEGELNVLRPQQMLAQGADPVTLW